MPVDDSVIKEKLLSLDSTISKLSLHLGSVQNVRNGFKKIQKYKSRIQDKKGLTKEVEVIPNPNNFSDADNAKVRNIIYDDCLVKFKKLNLK